LFLINILTSIRYNPLLAAIQPQARVSGRSSIDEILIGYSLYAPLEEDLEMAVLRRISLVFAALVVSMGFLGILNTPAWAAKNVCDYQQYDWSELSAAEKAAWQTLGYSAGMWDKGRDSAIAGEDWEELTPPQKKAAQFLGYTESSWDKGRC
jgi:hypothetical protein